LPDFVTRGSVTDRVALTFHCSGDTSLVDAMLHALSVAEVRSTLFVVGSWLETNSAYARRFLDAGHELANHTYSHPVLSSLSASAATTEIVKCRDVLQTLTGVPGKWFRPSGTSDGVTRPTATVMSAAHNAGYPVVVGYDIDPLDYNDPGASAVVSRVTSNVQPGSIVSLHFGHRGTVEALPPIVADLRKRGLRPVTVSDLLT
jgi:peptidoglycan/xylan/chitin deacetylase (PgdA/CDA1 family)